MLEASTVIVAFAADASPSAVAPTNASAALCINSPCYPLAKAQRPQLGPHAKWLNHPLTRLFPSKATFFNNPYSLRARTHPRRLTIGRKDFAGRAEETRSGPRLR